MWEENHDTWWLQNRCVAQSVTSLWNVFLVRRWGPKPLPHQGTEQDAVRCLDIHASVLIGFLMQTTSDMWDTKSSFRAQVRLCFFLFLFKFSQYLYTLNILCFSFLVHDMVRYFNCLRISVWIRHKVKGNEIVIIIIISYFVKVTDTQWHVSLFLISVFSKCHLFMFIPSAVRACLTPDRMSQVWEDGSLCPACHPLVPFSPFHGLICEKPERKEALDHPCWWTVCTTFIGIWTPRWTWWVCPETNSWNTTELLLSNLTPFPK